MACIECIYFKNLPDTTHLNTGYCAAPVPASVINFDKVKVCEASNFPCLVKIKKPKESKNSVDKVLTQ